MLQTILPRSRTSDGVAYYECGNGEPLILIHGVGMRLEAWSPQIAALSGVVCGRGRNPTLSRGHAFHSP